MANITEQLEDSFERVDQEMASRHEMMANSAVEQVKMSGTVKSRAAKSENEQKTQEASQ